MVGFSKVFVGVNEKYLERLNGFAFKSEISYLENLKKLLNEMYTRYFKSYKRINKIANFLAIEYESPWLELFLISQELQNMKVLEDISFNEIEIEYQRVERNHIKLINIIDYSKELLETYKKQIKSLNSQFTLFFNDYKTKEKGNIF